MNSILIIKRGLKSEVLKNFYPVQIKDFNKYSKNIDYQLNEITKMLEKNNEEIKNLKKKINKIEEVILL